MDAQQRKLFQPYKKVIDIYPADNKRSENMNRKVQKKPWFHRTINRRSLMIFISITLFISLFQTGYHIYFDYQNTVRRIDEKLRLIGENHYLNISSLLWNCNDEQLLANLKTIQQSNNVSYIEIRDTNQFKIGIGKKPEGKLIEKKFPLFLQLSQKNKVFGELYLAEDLKSAMSQTKEQVFMVLVIQILKNALLLLVIFLVIQVFVIGYITTESKKDVVEDPLSPDNQSLDNFEGNYSQIGLNKIEEPEVKTKKPTSLQDNVGSDFQKQNEAPSIVLGYRHFKVIIVSEDKECYLMLMDCLKDENYDIRLAFDKNRALTMLEYEKPHLLLLDIPDEYSVNIYEELRDIYLFSELPIIILSTVEQSDNHLHDRLKGSDGYLVKPVKKRELVSCMQNQIQIMLANCRMVSILEFSQNIMNFKDSKDLFKTAFDTVAQNIYFNVGVIQVNGKVFHRVGYLDIPKKNKYLQKLKEEVTITQRFVKEHGSGYSIDFCVDGFEEFRIYLFRYENNGKYSENALKYITNIFQQIHAIRDNVQKLTDSNAINDAILLIKQRLSKIKYIQADSPFCRLALEEDEERIDIPVTMKEIEFYMGEDSIFRVHRKYFVNPDLIESVRKKNQKDYELVFKDVVIPIGRTYLKRFKSKHTYLFDV